MSDTVKQPAFMYCLPQSEVMHYDPEGVWGDFIDPPESLTVEQWTVNDPKSLLPSADLIIENIVETAEHEGLADAYMEAAPPGGQVERLLDQALSLLAQKVRFFMADEKVREFVMERPTWVEVTDE